MKKNKAYLYRLYPNKQQVEQIEKTFGCCRFVYNRMLTLQNESYRTEGKYISWTKMNDYCNHTLKNEFPFLREADKFALTNSILSLDRAFRLFFDHKADYPHYKVKGKSKKSYATNYSHNNIAVLENAIKLPKLNNVKAKIHRRAPEDWTLKGATVSENAAGEFYCSVLYEYEETQPIKSLDERKAIGLDYKSNGLYVASNGTICGSPKYFGEKQNRLSNEQRRLSRMKMGSNNYRKQKAKVARIHRQIANQRSDFLHKEALALAEQYDIICVETLDMQEMSNKSFGNGKATLDNGYGMFLELLQYKLEDRGKVLIKIDRYFPSSQKCSVCSAINPKVKEEMLSEWRCPVCGTVHDRDVNAAKNILEEGLRVYRETMLGAA